MGGEPTKVTNGAVVTTDATTATEQTLQQSANDFVL